MLVGLSACGDGLHEFLNPYQLPVRGLTPLAAGADPDGARYRWTLNVGLLNDSEAPQLAVADVQPLLLEASTRLESLLPGLQVRFIIDQPMNSVFLIERSVKKKGFLGPKYDSDGPVLLLGPGPANADRNRKRLAAFQYGPEYQRLGVGSVEQELASLKRLQAAGCVSEKLPASEYVWRAYLAGQVRYDLVLTNALVYPDDVRQRQSARSESEEPLLRLIAGATPGTPAGGLFVRSVVVPMPGRSALEGYGGLVSLRDGSTDCGLPADGSGPGGERVDDLVRVLFELLRPTEIARSARADQSPAAYLKACGASCATAWQRRLVALDSMIELETGAGPEMCTRLDEHYDHRPAELSPARQAVAADIQNRFHRLCGKNR